MVPTARLVVACLIGSLVVLALPWGIAGLAVVNAVIVAAALVDARLAPAPAALTVDRSLPAALTIGGDTGEVSWRIANPTARPQSVAIADELAPSLHPSRRRARVRIPPGGTAVATASLQPARRGRFEPTELVVRVAGPLGLAQRQRRRALPGVLRVLPPFRSRQEAELRIQRARLDIGLRSARGRGGGTEFDALREYGVDDESRRIDWAATARALKPIVRTYRAERNQHVIALLDNGRLMAGQVEGIPRLEWGMDAVMMLTAVAGRLGDRCGLVAFDREVRSVVPPRAGAAQLTRVTEAMYDLEPELVESDYRGAFATALGRFRRRSLLVLVTELAEEAVSETLIPALPLILGRHLVIVASVLDPQLTRWAEDPPTDARGAFRAAAAVAALERRSRTVARLRGLGAMVIDAPPGTLSAGLADAYLKVKATGKL